MSDNLDDRQKLYWDLHDFSAGRGLEIGPLHRTIVPRSAADVRYVDVQDQAGLRAHYHGDPAVDPELIPEIDYVLIQEDGTTLGLAEAAAEGAPFAWIMASHVIEHVPDLIGWLAELAVITEDGGALILAVPDRRYCFDVLRPPTTVGQMIEAHDVGDTRPSVRAVYDYFTSVVHSPSAELWSGFVPGYGRRIHSMAEAEAKIEEVRSGRYIDCHVWLFSPQSFVEQLHELRISGRSAWMVEAIVPTPANDLEFRVRMRRLSRMSPTTEDLLGELTPTSERPDWLADLPYADVATQLRDRDAGLHIRLSKRKAQFRAMRQQRNRAHARAEHLQAELDNLRASRRWRAISAFAKPLAFLRRQ